MGHSWELDLLEVGGVYYKDGSAALARFGGLARFIQNINDGLHVLFFYADEQRDVAAPQEATGAGDAGHAMAAGYQLLDHGACICISNDSDD
jgi:hypothetical protein